MANDELLPTLFLSEPAGHFALGHVFNAVDGFAGPAEATDGVGYWRCDIADGNRLTWSKEVYQLFDIPIGSQVERDQAVARYTDHSKSVLERLRAFAINHKCGFILDAAIAAGSTGNQWIRLIAFPILESGRVVGLQGLKRAL